MYYVNKLPRLLSSVKEATPNTGMRQVYNMTANIQSGKATGAGFIIANSYTACKRRLCGCGVEEVARW